MGKVYDWLEERLELSKLAWIGTRTVPRGVNWWYTLGSATLIVFILLVLTGSFLLLYYDPSPERAYASVQFIGSSVVFGSLVRSIHHWSAYAMVLLVGLHAARVFFFAAYRYPREVTWIIGVLLLLLVIGMAFTGYLLPWDQRAYWATVVGTNIAGETPVVGQWVKALLVGGSQPGVAHSIATPTIALTRFFGLHVVILPALITMLITAHILLVVRLGISEPPGNTALACDEAISKGDQGRKVRKATYEGLYEANKKEGRPFLPDTLFHDTVIALLVVMAIFVLAAVLPAQSTGPANPIGTAFSPKPEWYFVWVQTLLRVFPGKLEPIGAVVLPLLAILVLLALPFFNRGLNRTFSKRKTIVGVGTVAVLLVIGLEIFGTLSPPTLAVPSAPAPPAGATYGQVAALGNVAFDNNCASCHGVDGQGVVAPALWGPKASLSKHNTAQGLLQFISANMPVGAPGSLSGSTYLDVLAYLVVQNNDIAAASAFDQGQLAGVVLK